MRRAKRKQPDISAPELSEETIMRLKQAFRPLAETVKKQMQAAISSIKQAIEKLEKEMGTRYLICVVLDGDYKIANFGRYDGFPEGAGAEIVDFLKKLTASKTTMRRFQRKLGKCEFENSSLYLRKNMNPAPEGTDILDYVLKSEPPIILKNRFEFAINSLFCEWAYVIDLDKGRLEVFKGLNREPLDPSERFYDFKIKYNDDPFYQPCRLLTAFDLSSMPDADEFVRLCYEKIEENHD